MKFSPLFLNRLQNLPVVHDTVVVIDTLRSFTTAAVALDRGAAAVYLSLIHISEPTRPY